MIKLFILSILLLSTQETLIKGKVIKVTDGDTITILTEDNKQVKIRFDGIDCPERNQDFGTKATNFTKDLCAGKNVTVKVKGTDYYRRTLGVVYVGSVNINESLLKQGLAWVYKYNKSKHYIKLEQEARMKKINIWSMKKQIAPWEWRKTRKTKK
ncbi:MAG: thermonuclease family protein [Prevotella sp.]|jgi:endonuclease YncB( thermonuclease family)|nr:thermonuclease family protein [Prevotella sp.]